MDTIMIELSVSRPEDILVGAISHLGYPGPEAVSDNILAQIDDGIDTCRKLARPEAICRSTAYTGLGKNAIRGERLCLETANWTRLATRMSGIKELSCFAITLGNAVDERISRLGKSAMLQALMLDAAASVLADLCADQIQQQVYIHYQRKGLKSSARFSPGYCDWPMQEGQRAIIPFLRPSSIGISVADSGLMTPRKSVSGAIIAAERMLAESPCFLCARDCRHRRAPYQDRARP